MRYPNDLMLPRWDSLAPEARYSVAARVAEDLPAFRLEGVETHSLGSQTHHIAFYARDRARFALIPGGEIVLGYDAAHWIPDDREREGWNMFLRSQPYSYPPLEEYIGQFLSPARYVQIQPFLLEASATPMGVRPVPTDDPAFESDMARCLLPGIGGAMRMKEGRSIEYYVDENLALHALEHTPVTHKEAAERVASEGFRLCDADEWEYACSGGARTLFRWGDHFPPIAFQPDPRPPMPPMNPWTRDPARLAELAAYLRQDPLRDPTRNMSLGLNAFGLRFPPWCPPHINSEICGDPNSLRGIATLELRWSYSVLCDWLPTASSYVYRRPVEIADRPLTRVAVRRALSLGD
jgi:hypothetical protein